jgi:hypothetical protein
MVAESGLSADIEANRATAIVKVAFEIVQRVNAVSAVMECPHSQTGFVFRVCVLAQINKDIATHLHHRGHPVCRSAVVSAPRAMATDLLRNSRSHSFDPAESRGGCLVCSNHRHPRAESSPSSQCRFDFEEMRWRPTSLSLIEVISSSSNQWTEAARLMCNYGAGVA